MSQSPSHGGAAPRIRVRGPWLIAIRIGWPLMILLALIGPYALSLPSIYLRYQRVCDGCAFNSGAAAALTRLGVSLEAYAWLAVGLTATMLVVSFSLGLITHWRSDEPISLLTSALIMMVTAIVGVAGDNVVHLSYILPSEIDAPLDILRIAMLSVLLYATFALFPSGRFVPRWSWALLASAAIMFFLANFGDTFIWLLPLFPLSLVVAIGCQVYRYRRVSTPIERQQTKWVVVGLALFVICNQLFYIPTGFTPLGQTLWLPVAWLLYMLAALFLPISFFLAIQRYGLFEIDRIINRALVYGALTAILVGVYIGIVIGLQSVFRATTGQESPIAVVASTLFIAALFQPLRGFLQRSIDRRFYRARYDARKTLASFSATLRQEVSLTELQAHLVAIVERTMRQAHVSLWLAPSPMAAPHTPNLSAQASSEERRAT